MSAKGLFWNKRKS